MMIVSCDSGYSLAVLQKDVNRHERFFDDLLHAHEAASNALFGQLEDSRFGIIENVFSRVGLVNSPRDRGVSGVNQPAQQGSVADDFDVVLDARTVGYAVEKGRNIAPVADRLQLLVAIELVDQRDDIDGPRRLRQVATRGEE